MKIAEDIEDANESPHLIIIKLKHELKKSNAKIVQLKAKINDDKSKCDLEQSENDIINQRNELLKMLAHKDNTIERMSSDIAMLEKQLKAAESAQFDALSRLDAVEGHELTLLFQKKRTEMMNECPKPLKGRHKMKDGILGQLVAVESQEKLQASENTNSRSSCGVVLHGKRARKDTSVESSTTDDNNYLTNVEMGTASLKCNQEEDFIGAIDNLASSHENKGDSNSSNIQLELLSQTRTRRQSQFIFDAFNR